MRRILHHRHDAAAVVGVCAFFDLWNRFHGEPGFHERLVTVVAKTDRERQLSFGQSIRELSQILADKKMLLAELLQILFAFDLPKESPGVLSRAGIARIEEADSAFPFRVKQVIVGANLSGIDLAAVVPQGFARVAEERVNLS